MKLKAFKNTKELTKLLKITKNNEYFIADYTQNINDMEVWSMQCPENNTDAQGRWKAWDLEDKEERAPCVSD